MQGPRQAAHCTLPRVAACASRGAFAFSARDAGRVGVGTRGMGSKRVQDEDSDLAKQRLVRSFKVFVFWLKDFGGVQGPLGVVSCHGP